MSSTSLSLSMNSAFWIMGVYVFACYGLASLVLARINRIYPGYFEIGTDDGGSPFGKTPFALREMIFDRDLPGDQCGQFVRIGLYVVRVMLVCFAPVFVLMIYLAGS